MSKLREFIEKLRRRWGRGPTAVTAMVRRVTYAGVLIWVVLGSLAAQRGLDHQMLRLNPYQHCSGPQLCPSRR